MITAFLKTQDDQKMQRMEWFLGFPQVNSRLAYNDDKFKFGVEIINTVNEDVFTFPSPLNTKPNENVILGICRKTQESTAALGLNFLLGLMAEDEDILDYVFNCPSPNYQYSRYTDWIKDFLDNLLSNIEKDNYP